MIDVLGVGAIAVDDVLVVDGYPGADLKSEVVERRRVCGGLSATALVAATRLGARCAYAGRLGTDELSTFALDELKREGIDIRKVVRSRSARPVHSVVVVDRGTGTRNIFFDLSGYAGPGRRSPAASVIRNARVVLVDHLGLEGMIRVARVASAASVAVVADLEGGADSSHFGELLGVVDHLILPERFAAALTGYAKPADAVDALWTQTRAAVVITSGAAGCWYRGRGAEPLHCPAFPVTVRDTSGCGDVFHGAYAAGLARGLALADRVRLAAAAAAIAATGVGGQASAPRYAAVSALLTRKAKPL